jgi:hypothetical protein
MKRSHLIFSAATILLPAVALSFTGGKAEQQPALEQMIAHPSQWRTFDWSNTSGSGVFNDTRWIQDPNAKPDDNGSGRLVSHKRQLSALGESWEAGRWRTVSSSNGLMITINRSLPTEQQCSQAALEVGRELGPTVQDNQSTRQYFGNKDNYVEMTLLRWQWTIGTTRVEATCMGVGGSSPSDPTALLNVAYASTETIEAYKPSFLLRCSQELTLGVAGTPRAMDDLVIWVNGNKPASVRNALLAQLGTSEETVVDDTEIAYAFSGKAKKYTTKIDRVTGSLSTEIRDGARVVGTIKGKCEKVNTATKF